MHSLLMQRQNQIEYHMTGRQEEFTDDLTPEQRLAFDLIYQRNMRYLQPTIDSIQGSQILTANDFGVTINRLN